MEDLKRLVKKLEQTSNEKEQIRLLQEIGNKRLSLCESKHITIPIMTLQNLMIHAPTRVQQR